jgi:enoyl-CoA hydratase/carnithine racemase
MSDRVTIDIDNGIADVRLNRPDKRNALDLAMFAAIDDAGERLKQEPGIRAVVVSGEGKSFCAGLDLSMFTQLDAPGQRDDAGNPGLVKGERITHVGQQVAWAWQEIPVPVIAAIHGHAIGGGFQIALGADVRIAHPDTVLSVREVHYGLIPDMTGTLFLSRLTRPDVAKELVFTARLFDAREAHALGIVTRLSDDPRADALALAGEIAGRSPDAVRAAKRLINGMANADAAAQFEAERIEIAALVGSPNQLEAVMSSVEQRPPRFTDPR